VPILTAMPKFMMYRVNYYLAGICQIKRTIQLKLRTLKELILLG
jgi:hypothetical protein